MTTPHKNTDNRIHQKRISDRDANAFQSEMISKYFLVFHQKETSSVFPQCSQISIKFFKILRFHGRTCGETTQRHRFRLWKTLWKLLKMQCFQAFVFHISHRMGCGKVSRTKFPNTFDDTRVHRFTPSCFPQADDFCRNYSRSANFSMYLSSFFCADF